MVQQVALGRGMNLVLHRAQVALNMPDFDISDQVADQLNKMLPTVVIPPDGVSVSALQPAPAATAAAGTDAAPAAPPTTAAAQASAPAATASAATPAKKTPPPQHK